MRVRRFRLIGKGRASSVRLRRGKQVYTGARSGSRQVPGMDEFGDDHCPCGPVWFVCWRIGLGHWDVDLSETSGPPRLVGKKMVRREALYSDFIAESARLPVDTMEDNRGDPHKMVQVYRLLSRMRLSSSSRVLETAEEVIKIIVSTYQQQHLTAKQIRSLAANDQGPLRLFGSTSRNELDSLRKQL